MYFVTYDKLVYEKDFRKINQKDRGIIIKNIERKLFFKPNAFGKPLKGPLKGLNRLRIMQYRVIYKILKEKIEVFVIHIGFRRGLEVYLEATKRLKY